MQFHLFSALLPLFFFFGSALLPRSRRGGERGVMRGRPGRLRRLLGALRDDTGAVTAEYAIVIMGAVAFAGALVAILRSSEVKQILLDLVHRALTVA